MFDTNTITDEQQNTLPVREQAGTAAASPTAGAPEPTLYSPDERRAIDAARIAVGAIKRTFEEHWLVIGRALLVLRAKADVIRKKTAFLDLRTMAGLGRDYLPDSECTRLLAIMDNFSQIEAWRAGLTEQQRFRWASPLAVHRHCPLFAREENNDAQKQQKKTRRTLKEDNADLERKVAELQDQIDEYQAAEDAGEDIGRLHLIAETLTEMLAEAGVTEDAIRARIAGRDQATAELWERQYAVPKPTPGAVPAEPKIADAEIAAAAA